MPTEKYPGSNWDRVLNLGRSLRRGIEVGSIGVVAVNAPHSPAAIIFEAGIATAVLGTEIFLSAVKRRKIQQAEPIIFTNFRFPITFSRRAQGNALSV